MSKTTYQFVEIEKVDLNTLDPDESYMAILLSGTKDAFTGFDLFSFYKGLIVSILLPVESKDAEDMDAILKIYQESKSFRKMPSRITEFADWLKKNYTLYINSKQK